MRVTDAQVHIWDTPNPKRPEGRRGGVFLVDELESDMAHVGVDRVVLVPPRYPGTAQSNNRYSLAVASEHPERFSVMARLDRAADDSKAYLAELAALPYVRGLRLHLASEGWDATDSVWSESIRLGMTTALFAGRGSFGKLLPILDKNPDLSVLIDHVALPAAGPDPFADFDKVLSLEKYQNVVVKCSALTRYSREPYPFHDLAPYIRRLVDTFGPERLAWGSDYNTHSERVTYRQTVDLFRVVGDSLSAEDRDWILDKTLSRVLDWS